MERRQGGGVPFLVYEPRPHSMREVLAAGGRWTGRDHVVHRGRRMRFEEVVDAASRVAGHLTAEGVKPGDRVLLLGGNSIAWVVAFWAIVDAGAVIVLGNAWWNGPEVEHAVRLTEPRLTLAPASLLERLPAGSIALDLDQLELAGNAGTTPAGAPADSGGHPRGPRAPGDED
ncbi:MAG: AMP-binding protein, partial [Acidimicrobiia bacterium]